MDGVMSNVTVTSDYFRSASCRHTVYNVTLPQDGGVAARAQPDAGGAGAVLLRGAPPRPPHRRAGVLQGAHRPGDGGIHRVPGGDTPPCLNSLHLISPQELRGDLASWDEAAVWTVSGNVSRTSLDTEDVCSEAGPRAGLLMVTDINYIISTTINIYMISTNICCTRCFPRTPAGPGAATCVGGSEAACTWTPRQPRHG